MAAETKWILAVVDRATAPIRGIQQAMGGLAGTFNTVRQSILGVQSAAALFVTGWLSRAVRDFATEFTRTAASFEAMQMRFKALGSPDYTDQVVAFARKNPLVGLQQTQDAFVKLYAAGINPTSKALQSLADAVAVFGGTSQDMEKAMVAIVQMAGKGCHARGTLIRMFDGSERKVEEIKAGDALMGPDGVRRNVLICAHGREDMFKVIPASGEAFIVNHGHIMRVVHGNGVQQNLRMSEYLLMTQKERNDYSLVHVNGSVMFEVQPAGIDDFFGFMIDNDHLYIDAQGFVHHNTVNMEELRQQLGERIPNAITIMAKKLGYGEERMGDFYKAIEQGKVTAREGLTALFDGLGEKFAGAGESMKNTWNGLVAEMSLEWELFKKDFMDEETFNRVKQMIRDLFQTFLDNKDAIVDFLKLLLTLVEKIAQSMTVIARTASVAFQAGKKGVTAGIGYASGAWSKYQGFMNKYVLTPMGMGWDPNYKTYADHLSDAMLEESNIAHEKMRAGIGPAANAWAKLFGAKGTKASTGVQTLPEVTVSAPYFLKDLPKKESGFYPAIPFVPGTFSEGFRAELQKMEADFNETFGNMAKMGKESAKIVADAMAGAFNDFFIDALEGRLKQFKDYLLSFFTSIGRAISQILSQYLATQALGYMMPGMAARPGNMGPSMAGAGAGGAGPAIPGRMKGMSTPSVQIVNNSGIPMEGRASYSTNDMGDTIMTVILDAVGRNKGGSRDALRGMLA